MARPRHSRPSFDDLTEWKEQGERLDGMPIPAARNAHDHAAHIRLDPQVSSSLAINIDRDWIEQLESALAGSPIAGLFGNRSQLIRACVWLGASRLLDDCDPADTWSLRLRYVEAEMAAERERELSRRLHRDTDDPRVKALMDEYDRLFSGQQRGGRERVGVQVTETEV